MNETQMGIFFSALGGGLVLFLTALSPTSDILAQSETDPETTALVSNITAFSGDSITVLVFGHFWDDPKLQAIDQFITANDLDIKSIVPFNEKYFVVLENSGGQ